jgi:hypothetical protein
MIFFCKFFQRLKLLSDKSNAHQRELFEKYVNQEANIIEQQMAVHHRLDTSINNNENMEGPFLSQL